MLHTDTSEFGEIALQSASDFRLIMEAMSRPGKVMNFDEIHESTGTMNAGSSMVAMTLCDHETPVWLDDELSTKEVKEFVRFNCSSPITTDPGGIQFGFFSKPPSNEELERFPLGTPAYPDRSATLVIQIDGLSEGSGVVLGGPGIKTIHKLNANGLEKSFWNWWQQNNMRFPLGIDVILTTDTSIAALPRTVHVMEVV